jgi:APA family basic amino acid/polyamine antiporter
MNSTSPQAESPITSEGLARGLGLHQSVAIVVGTVIGSGIFLVPAEMMQALGSSSLVYLAWIVGGLLSFFGALTYAELAAMKPQVGGEYVYLRDGYGPLAGFLYAWTYFVVAKPGSMATIATGFVRILSRLPAFSYLGTSRGDVWYMTWQGEALAIGAVIGVSFINYIGVRKAGEFQFAFTLLKVAIVIAVVAIGFTYAAGSLKNFQTHYAGATGGIAGFTVALMAALWAYDGWNLVTTVSSEIRRPQRNLPIALVAGVGTVAVLYIAVNAAVQYVMPAAQVAASPSPASQATFLAVGATGAAIVSAGMGIAMLATLNGSTLTGARVPFAVARDGLFFKGLAHVHPRFRTPSTAVVAQGVLAIALLLFRGSFQEYFSVTLFAEWMFYLLVTSTVFIFRRREPNAARPYKTWGYPVVPALFIAAAAVLLYYTFVQNLRISVLGLALILAGTPVYAVFSRRRARR